MIINGIAKGFTLKFRVILTLGIFILLFFASPPTHSQTADDEKNFQQCKACHTIGGGKLVGPDLKGVNDKREESWLIKFIQNSQALIQSGDKAAIEVFEAHFKIPMPPHNLTDDQVRGILAYIRNDGKIAGAEATVTESPATGSTAEELSIAEENNKLLAEKKSDERRNMRSTFIIMLVLLVISVADLVITKMVKAKWIHIVIILVSVAVIGELIFVEAVALGRQQYYQPA